MRSLGFGLAPAIAAILLGTVLPAQDAPTGSAPKPARELFTTSAGLTDPGVLLLNAGTQTSYYRDGSQAQRFPTEVELGICQWFDLRAIWNGPTIFKNPEGASQKGGADPIVGGQFQGLHQDQAGLDLGLAYWHKLPRASVEKGIGTGKADDTLLLTATRSYGRWELDMNAGANWLGRQDGDGRQRQGVASLAVTRNLGRWNASLDTYALAATELSARSITSILVLSRDLTADLTVDLGVESGLTRSAERLAIDAGVVWRMGRFWGKD